MPQPERCVDMEKKRDRRTEVRRRSHELRRGSWIVFEICHRRRLWIGESVVDAADWALANICDFSRVRLVEVAEDGSVFSTWCFNARHGRFQRECFPSVALLC